MNILLVLGWVHQKPPVMILGHMEARNQLIWDNSSAPSNIISQINLMYAEIKRSNSKNIDAHLKNNISTKIAFCSFAMVVNNHVQ